MEARSPISATRLVASTFGIFAGLGGIRHGIGEILQGNVAPDRLVIHSWTQGPLATNMGGEPALTIVPNLLATGILAVIVSLVVMIWAAVFVQRTHGGWMLVLLSLVLFLVGGGFGPPITGVLAGLAGTRIGAPLPWWRTHVPLGWQRFQAWMWPWVFGLAVLNGLFLFIGSLVLVYVFGVNNPDLFLNSFLLVVVLLPLSTLTGIGFDIEQREPDRVVREQHV